jgi:glutamate-1-semialdehyde aminotransferase
MHLMGIGCCTLGYADDEVDDAVRECTRQGNMTSLNCYEEYELAELLLKLNPAFSMARFSRLGCDALSQVIRVARSYTGKSKVLYWGYHGWHDWYMAGECHDGLGVRMGVGPNGQPNAGIPKCLKKKVGHYVLDESLEKVAAVIIEPALFTKKSLQEIQDHTTSFDVPLIFDEVTSGLRTNMRGVYWDNDIIPDMIVYGKALGNGYPICAILGKEDFMCSYNNTFISSTFNTERTGFVAAIATLTKMYTVGAQEQLKCNGGIVKRIWEHSAKEFGLKIELSGIDPLATFEIVGDERYQVIDQDWYATIYQQEMVKQGILAGSQYYASVAHRSKQLLEFGNAVYSTFENMTSDNARLEGRLLKRGVKHI